MRRSDPLILGGGPAGAAAAIRLAQGGAKPLIFERQRETGDALCGGFMSWRTLQTLETLGVKISGHPVSRLTLFAGNASAEARLPAGAVGVSRRQLDTQLLARAEQLGVAIERGVLVREVAGSSVRLEGGEELDSDSLFIATGKHDLRGIGRVDAIADDPTLGLRVRVGPHPALSALVSDSIELHLFAGGYAGIELQEDGSANICMALAKSALEGASPAVFLKRLGSEHPRLGERLAYMDAAPQIDAIAAIPYGWRATQGSTGRFRLGDQAAVIPSLAGEGNGIALASGLLAARHWLEGGAASGPAFQRALAAATSRPVGLATRIWHLAERPVYAKAATRIISALPFLAETLARATRIRA
jgi:menaquinone-9 beta-reductase